MPGPTALGAPAKIAGLERAIPATRLHAFDRPGAIACKAVPVGALCRHALSVTGDPGTF